MSKIALAVSMSLALAAVAHAAEDDVLDEVTVFAERARAATKTDTKLVEVPQSISVVTAEQIEERGALNYQDVFRYSAGVDTERFGADTRSDDFSVRGFPVVQYLDELNRTPDVLYGSRIEVFTLERAEVLRGPSAVLYGAGSSGGLLNAVSKRPTFKFGGQVGAEFGNYERKQVQADIHGGFNDTLAGRFVGVLRDGELQSEGQANDKYVLMPSLMWRPSEATEITLLALYQDEDLGTQTYLPLSKTLNATPGQKLPIDVFIGEPGFNGMQTEHLAGTLLVHHRFNDWITASSHSRYMDQTVDYREVYGSYYNGMDPFLDEARTLLTREFYILDEDYKVLNTDNHVQLEFATGPISHKVLVGVDYTRFEQDRQEGFSCRDVTDGSFGCFAGGSPPPLDVYNPQYGQPFDAGFTNAYTTESTQRGFYFQDQMKYGERVSVVLGVRRDRSTSSSSTGGGAEDVNQATTFRGGLIVEVIEGVSPYVSYSESFQPVFGGDFFGVPFKPREGRQYEGGIKWQPLPNSLVSVSYFDIEESNFVTADPDNIQNFIQAGAVGAKGYEFEAIFSLASGFNLTLNYSHTKAEVLEGTLDHPAGDRIEELPEDLASFWVSQVFDLTSEWALRVGAGARYVGDKIDYYQTQKTPSVTLGDAAIELSNGTWNASVNVNNVTDKEFYALCSAWGPTDGACHPGLTRSIVGSVSRKF